MKRIRIVQLHICGKFFIAICLLATGCLPSASAIPPTAIYPIVTTLPHAVPSPSITRTPPVQTYRKGSNTFIYFDSCFDLDEGSGSAGVSPGCDVLIQSDAAMRSRIVITPLSSARFALDEPYPSQPSPEQCRSSTHLSRDPEVITPLLSADYCYQTGTGRYGYLRFKEIASNGVLLEWHTFDTPVITTAHDQGVIPTRDTTATAVISPTPFHTETIPPYWTHSEGWRRPLKYYACFDLDRGTDADTPTADCDFFINPGSSVEDLQIEIVPYPPAVFTFWRSFDEPPAFNDCRRAPAYTRQATIIAPLELGYLCYQTGEGRFGFLRFITSSAEGVTIDWRTFNPALDLIEISSILFYPAFTDLGMPDRDTG